MAGLKSLAKDTAIYGLSSIVGRFLNYLLVPLYTAVIPAASGGYGVVSNVYAYTALILVFLTFGMETGFFRFANKSDEDPQKVYANVLIFVGGLSLMFIVACLAFLHPIATLLEYPDHPDYIAMMALVVALDSFQCMPFAYLRYKKRPIKFAAIKLFSIIGNIGLNLFFLLLCPLPFTCAKSRTRLSKALAIRGVPLLREAISPAASKSHGMPNMPDERSMMRDSTLSS